MSLELDDDDDDAFASVDVDAVVAARRASSDANATTSTARETDRSSTLPALGPPCARPDVWIDVVSASRARRSERNKLRAEEAEDEPRRLRAKRRALAAPGPFEGLMKREAEAADRKREAAQQRRREAAASPRPPGGASAPPRVSGRPPPLRAS